MAGFNWMDYIKGYGTGSQGASGVYSNMNQKVPGMGSLLQNGQKAGNTKYMLSGMNALAKGNMKEGIKSGIGYALNQNPYIAAINTFNNLTGGIRFDKALGLGPKKPQPTASQQRAQLDYGQQLSDEQNNYLSQASKAADTAQRYDEYLTNERNAVRDLEQNGPSARSIAPMLGQFSGANNRAAGAARSSLASNLSQRGLSPSGGIGAGAAAAIETGLAANEGQQNSAVMNQVMDMLQTRRQNMMGIDAQGRKDALARQESMMDTASTLGLKGRELDLTQRRLDDLRSQQMFERRQAEQNSIGRFAGAFGPGLLEEYQRYLRRKNPDTSDVSAGIVKDFEKADRMAGVLQNPDNSNGYIEPPLSFGDYGVRPSVNPGVTQSIYGPSQEFTYDQSFAGPRQNQNAIPILGNDFFNPVYPNLNPTSGRLGNLDIFGPSNIASGPEALEPNQQQAQQDVFNMQNPYALEGQVIEYQGQFFRKTSTGWEKIG